MSTDAMNTSNNNEFSSDFPELLNSLPQHEILWEANGGDDFRSEKDKGSNKLEIHTDSVTGNVTAFCQLISMNDFSMGSGDNITYSASSYESALATMLAVQHLNAGDGSIISEIDGLPDRCPIRFSVDFMDTQSNVATALKHTIALTHPITATDQDDPIFASHLNHIPPCAFIGASRSSVSGPVSVIAGLEGFVLLSGQSTSSDLDDRNRYPRFARTIPSDEGTAEALVLFLHHELNIDYLAVISINDSFGNAYASRIRDAARLYCPEMEILQIPVAYKPDYSISKAEIQQAVWGLKRSEYLFSIVIFLDNISHDAFMLEAYRMGLAGSGQHNFLFTDGFDVNGLTNRVFEYGSELHLAYSGTGIIRAGGGILGESRFDKFKEELRRIKQSTNDFRYAASLLPGDPSPLLSDDSFFNPTQLDHASYNFDATILMGMAACDAVKQGMVLFGGELYNQLPNTFFEGITGPVILDSTKNSRVTNSTYFKVFNLVDVDNADTGDADKVRKVRFQPTVTHQFTDGQWEMKEAYIFSDGTSNLPGSLWAVEVNNNYIHPATRVVVLLFSAVSILSAIVCAVWTWRNRSTRIVRASQPFFLGLLCFGVVIFASTIIPLSFDGGNLNLEGLSGACTATVWLVNLGAIIIFSALFSKTHRVNKIMKHAQQYKRIKVTVCDTLLPMALSLGGT
jgi:hypothetical protein